MTNQQLGLWIVFAGLGVVIVGFVVWAGGLAWFGKLPGDLRFRSGSTVVFLPITSMILVSVVLSVVLTVVLQLLGRR